MAVRSDQRTADHVRRHRTTPGALNDTWAYDPVANAWTELKPSGTLPPPAPRHAMAYDPVTRRLILFGGFGEHRRSLNDTWAYDPAANAWTELKPCGHAAPGTRPRTRWPTTRSPAV